MVLTARTRVLVSAVAAVAVWSPLHIALTHRLDFSSWKLGGFGMFAEPHPGFTHVAVVVFAPGSEPNHTRLADVPLGWWGRKAGGDTLVQGIYVEGSGTTALATGDEATFGSHTYSGLTGARTQLVRSVQSLRRKDDIRTLVDAMAGGRPFSSAVIVFDALRLRVWEGVEYIHSCPYLVENGEVRRGRCFDSDRDPIGALGPVDLGVEPP